MTMTALPPAGMGLIGRALIVRAVNDQVAMPGRSKWKAKGK
jgi:hypothetical protein